MGILNSSVSKNEIIAEMQIIIQSQEKEINRLQGIIGRFVMSNEATVNEAREEVLKWQEESKEQIRNKGS